MEKILITGASGMLGRYVQKEVEKVGLEVVAPSRTEMDLMDPKKVYDYVVNVKPTAVLHLAAETDVDLCEREPHRGGIANHLATKAVAEAARDTGAWLLSISTSNVFGAEPKPISNELDTPCPVNYYGRSKLFAEREIDKIYSQNSLIIRAGWMIGGGREHDHKFVGKLVSQISKGTEVLRAVADKYGTLTSAATLAHFVVRCLKVRRQGLVHYASEGVVSRFDIAVEFAQLVGFKGRLEPVSSGEFPLSAPRPMFEGINSIYLRPEENTSPGPWRDELRDYLTEFDF